MESMPKIFSAAIIALLLATLAQTGPAVLVGHLPFAFQSASAAPGPPDNDNFSDARDLTFPNGSANEAGTVAEASTEPGEPGAHGFTGEDCDHRVIGQTVWFRFQAPSTGTLRLAASSSFLSPVRATHTGSTL